MSLTLVALLPPADVKARILSLAKSPELADYPALKARLSVIHARLSYGAITQEKANKELGSIFSSQRNIKASSLSKKEFYKNLFSDTFKELEAIRKDNLLAEGRQRPLPKRMYGKLFELVWQFDNGWIGLLKERLSYAIKTNNCTHAKKIMLKAEDLDMMGQWVEGQSILTYPRPFHYSHNYELEGTDGQSYLLNCTRVGKLNSEQFNFTLYRFLSEPSAKVIAVKDIGASHLDDALAVEDSTSYRFLKKVRDDRTIKRVGKDKASDNHLPLNTEPLTHLSETKHAPKPMQVIADFDQMLPPFNIMNHAECRWASTSRDLQD